MWTRSSVVWFCYGWFSHPFFEWSYYTFLISMVMVNFSIVIIQITILSLSAHCLWLLATSLELLDIFLFLSKADSLWFLFYNFEQNSLVMHNAYPCNFLISSFLILFFSLSFKRLLFTARYFLYIFYSHWAPAAPKRLHAPNQILLWSRLGLPHIFF